MIGLEQARAWLAAQVVVLPGEAVPLAAAAGRVLADAVVATALPPHAVAAIDGVAVRAAETEGASEYASLPAPGRPVVAGAPLPEGADAVLDPSRYEGGAALAPAASGEGVLPEGHDAEAGWVLPAGTVLRPLHLALLAGLGHDTVPCVRRPRVRVRVAGPKHGADALTPLLHALGIAAGAELAGDAPDLVIHAGRSGPGPDDDGVAAFTAVFAHGVAIRPGETAALGTIDGVAALLLPGAPAACATGFALLAAPMLRRMGGQAEPAPVMATLTRKIASALGQIDAVCVRLDGAAATPLGPADCGGLARLAGADGLVLVPEGSEGYPPGAMVPVHPLP